MNHVGPHTVFATYRVQAAREEAFFELLREHYPTLKRLGLVTDEIPIIYRGTEGDGRPIVFEIFTWTDEKAPKVAHESPEVARVWEAMGTMVEERDGKPMFEFPHVERREISFA